jgi:hypothetical protein
MARRSTRLPTRFPPGSAYVVEARGSVQGMTLMHRYVRFPDGRRVELTARLVPACGKASVLTVKSGKAAAPSRRSPTGTVATVG